MTERYRPHSSSRPGSPTHSCAAARQHQQARRNVPAEVQRLATDLRWLHGRSPCSFSARNSSTHSAPACSIGSPRVQNCSSCAPLLELRIAGPITGTSHVHSRRAAPPNRCAVQLRASNEAGQVGFRRPTRARRFLPMRCARLASASPGVDLGPRRDCRPVAAPSPDWGPRFTERPRGSAAARLSYGFSIRLSTSVWNWLSRTSSSETRAHRRSRSAWCASSATEQARAIALRMPC